MKEIFKSLLAEAHWNQPGERLCNGMDLTRLIKQGRDLNVRLDLCCPTRCCLSQPRQIGWQTKYSLPKTRGEAANKLEGLEQNETFPKTWRFEYVITVHGLVFCS